MRGCASATFEHARTCISIELLSAIIFFFLQVRLSRLKNRSIPSKEAGNIIPGIKCIKKKRSERKLSIARFFNFFCQCHHLITQSTLTVNHAPPKYTDQCLKMSWSGYIWYIYAKLPMTAQSIMLIAISMFDFVSKTPVLAEKPMKVPLVAAVELAFV
jgi:hypothetical protein